MGGFAFIVFTRALTDQHGKESTLAKAIGKDRKGTLSAILYVIAIPLALWKPILALLIYVTVAIIYFAPDRRIENSISKK
jgi:uncharacterized membrane protein